MKLTRNLFTIADLNNWLENRSLVVNKEYQRERGLWPNNPRSYFIDSILNDYPFPKITIRQIVDLRTKKSQREIIDGQQRMMAINDFLNDKFALSQVSINYSGKRFSDLDDEIQKKFLSYEISVDTVIGAVQDEVLEIFRRINSYTLPLNDAEKRHATYQGEFKWFIKDLLGLYSPLLESNEIFTLRQLSRMADADLMTELCQILMEGIVTRSPKKLEGIYKDNDKIFTKKDSIKSILTDTLDFIKVNLVNILRTGIVKPYLFYSLFSGLVYNKYGIPNIQPIDVGLLQPIDDFTLNLNAATQIIFDFLSDLEKENEDGIYGEFVKACLSTTHSVTNRKIRLNWFVKAFQNTL